MKTHYVACTIYVKIVTNGPTTDGLIQASATGWVHGLCQRERGVEPGPTSNIVPEDLVFGTQSPPPTGVGSTGS